MENNGYLPALNDISIVATIKKYHFAEKLAAMAKASQEVSRQKICGIKII